VPGGAVRGHWMAEFRRHLIVPLILRRLRLHGAADAVLRAHQTVGAKGFWDSRLLRPWLPPGFVRLATRRHDPAAYFRQTFVTPGLVAPQDVVAGSHSLAPTFLQHQLDRSLANLNVSCIDLYYLHNPETQLEEVPADRFHGRMRAAFEVLERNVEAGKIRCYGVATWNGGESIPELIRRADAALYTAKRAGRNRVEAAGPSSELSVA